MRASSFSTALACALANMARNSELLMFSQIGRKSTSANRCEPSMVFVVVSATVVWFPIFSVLDDQRQNLRVFGLHACGTTVPIAHARCKYISGSILDPIAHVA
ncbi:hypothetical protein ABW54_10540 [Burkholderia cenocepacia]|nr:hypothetical protein ABW54_10540 [Burkholderia cenocepacia]